MRRGGGEELEKGLDAPSGFLFPVVRCEFARLGRGEDRGESSGEELEEDGKGLSEEAGAGREGTGGTAAAGEGSHWNSLWGPAHGLRQLETTPKSYTSTSEGCSRQRPLCHGLTSKFRGPPWRSSA